MRVLITGGTGFTGSHLVKRLLKKGYEVRVIDNQPGLFHDELKSSGAIIELGSITDQAFVDRLVKGCEMVFHLAAAFRQLNVPDDYYWDVNVEGTRYLLNAALRCGVKRFVYCSTQGVHGHIHHAPGNEQSPIMPEDYYQLTKYEAEKVVTEYVKKGLYAVTLRPTAIYGPGDPGRFLILYRLVQKGYFFMFGNGKTFYHPLYIDNLVDAFELASERDGICGETYLIGDERNYSLNELVRSVSKAMGVSLKIYHFPFFPLSWVAWVCEFVCKPFRISPPLFPRRVDWFRQVRAFKISKAQKELGFVPKVDLETGLRITGDWYKANGYLR